MFDDILDTRKARAIYWSIILAIFLIGNFGDYPRLVEDDGWYRELMLIVGSVITYRALRGGPTQVNTLVVEKPEDTEFTYYLGTSMNLVFVLQYLT